MIVIIGAGPIGVAAALEFATLGHTVHIFDRGLLAQNMRDWGHVRMFSPWKLNVSERGVARMKEMGIPLPDMETFPTGAYYVLNYLSHLVQHPNITLHEHSTVIAVGREGFLKGDGVMSPQRTLAKFRVLVGKKGDTSFSDTEKVFLAATVINCAGCHGGTLHNYIGDSGIPALGERLAAASGFITYGIPDVAKGCFEGKHTVVVGAGYSAATTLHALEKVGATVTWVTRSASTSPYNRIVNDTLPARDELAEFGNTLTQRIPWFGGVTVAKVNGADKSVTLSDGRVIENVDSLVAQVGCRPDLSILSELQVHYCWATDGPMEIAASLMAAGGGTGGDCLTQKGLGPDVLRNPEPGLFILGASSYGRSRNFLIKLGLEQINDLVGISFP